MLVPSDSDFRARGLSSVAFSSNQRSRSTFGRKDREPRLGGTAVYTPINGHSPGGDEGFINVEFRIDIASNSGAFPNNPSRPSVSPAVSFHSPSRTSSGPSGPSSTLSSSSSSSLPPHIASSSFSSSSAGSRVVASWDDSFGSWVLSTLPPDRPATESLQSCWSRLIGGGGENGRRRDVQREEGGVSASEEDGNKQGDEISSEEEEDKLVVLKRYGEGVGLLVQIVGIIETLHAQEISIVACRPEFFDVSLRPTNPTSLDSVPSSQLQVNFVSRSECMALPGYLWNHLPIPAMIPLPSSPRRSESSSQNPSFQHQELDLSDMGATFNENIIRKHLRFLSPETISSHRVTETGDIFSFGVAAYSITTERQPDSTTTQIDTLTDVADHLNSSVTPPHEILSSIPIELSLIIMKCLSKELDERYSSVQALLHDLKSFEALARQGPDLSELVVGSADQASRFNLPRGLVDRAQQLEVLTKQFGLIASGKGGEPGEEEAVDDDVLEFGMEELPRSREETEGSAVSSKSSGKLGVVSLWGVSGSGKSRLVEIWAKELEGREGGPLIGWAKLDLHLRKPLAAFVQIFESLLDRVFSDPKENDQVWKQRILHALSGKGRVFLNLVSWEWRQFLAPEMTHPSPIEGLDWENMLQGFRIWSKRLIQLFASSSRPLILVLDDVQWLGPEELKLWQDILDSPSNPLKSILVVSLHRVDKVGIPPPISTFVSSRSTVVPVERFGAGGVTSFLQECFSWDETEPSMSSLVDFLFTETEGSPFFLRSIVTSLVQDGTISFSFDDLRWKFDSLSLLSLRSRLSGRGVDAYLDKLLRGYPEDVRSALQTLACLPSAGFEVLHLGELLDLNERAIESLLGLAGLFVAVQGSRVRFTHDRNLAAALSLLSPTSRGETLLRISRFLRRVDLLDNYLYDAVDNAVAARALGFIDDENDELAELAIRAAQRSALSASFPTSFAYLEIVETLVDLSDPTTWNRLRGLCFSFAQLYAEVGGVLKKPEVETRIRGMLKFAETALEDIQLRTSLVRLLLAACSYSQACDETFLATSRAGYDIHQIPSELLDLVPKSPEEVRHLSSLFDASETPPSEALSVKLAVLAILAFAGPTIYVSQTPTTRAAAYTLAIAILCSSSTTLRSDPSSYLVGVYSLTSVEDVQLKFSFSELALRIVNLRPGSYFESPGLTAVLLDSHAWNPLSQIVMTVPFESAVACGNWDVAGYVLGSGLAIKAYASIPFSIHLPKTRSWLASSIPCLTETAKVLIGLPLQYVEIITNPELLSLEQPWRLDGIYIHHDADFALIKDLPFHSIASFTFTLRLALLFNAGEETLSQIVEQGERVRLGAGTLMYYYEWLFLSSFFYARHGTTEDQTLLERNMEELRRFPSVDFKMRVELLEATRTMRRCSDNGGLDWLDVLGVVDATLSLFAKEGFSLFEGILSVSVARFVLLVAQNRSRLSIGYLRASNEAFIAAEAYSVAQIVREQHPSAFTLPLPRPLPSLPSHLLATRSSSDATSGPQSNDDSSQLAKTSYASSQTSLSLDLSEGDLQTPGEPKLDDLAFMRSSLLLASERDPNALVVTVIKLLCQFVRADFGALALLDDSNSLRLRGAGAYSSLKAFDLEVSNPEAATVAPVTLLLHVGRTKKAIVSPSGLQKLRNDPFFSKTPRSILVLPLTQQGRYVGVLLLSSKTVVTPPSQIGQLSEVVSCLATFAAIALESSQSTAKLESLVTERTTRLQDALSAKTTFLSHMSHELRTPLFAVLGLAAVLEDSPGLNSVQRDHLATIRSSGEDLQNVVTNILDFSRLESESLQPESIPFSLRDVVESTLDSVATLASKKDLDMVLATPCTTDPPTLIGDPFRIKQILMNLSSNAIKFTPEGGGIVVRWKIESRDPSRVFVRLSVSDTGPGIPPHKMDRLFKSFSQIDNSITRSYGGSGLGLAISQSLARLMGGDCSVKSAVGSGSTFSFSFLVSTGEDKPTAFPPFETGRNSFVLVAPGVFRETIEEQLRGFGVPSTGANDVSTALSLFNNTLYSVVIVDSKLVTLEEVQKLRKLHPKSKFFFLSPIAQLTSTIERLKVTHGDMLPRPLRAATLYNAVAPLAEGSSLSRPKKVKVQSEIDPDLARKHPLHILLVDDNRVNCLVGVRVLERFGYTKVATAFDGLEGVEKAEASGEFDLVLMDLQMPVLDGYQANARINESCLAGHPCVVALSANTDDVTMSEVQRQSFTAYLSKPLSIPALAETLVLVHGIRESRKKHLPLLVE